MYKIMTFLISVLLVLSTINYSVATDQVPNSLFDDWEEVNMGIEPADWNTFNVISQNFMNMRTVDRSEDSHTGNYSLYLENFSEMLGSGPSLAWIGDLNLEAEDPANMLAGGFEMTEKPSAFSFHYKGDIAASDSVMIIIRLESDAVEQEFAGFVALDSSHSTTEWTEFTLTLSIPPQAPDPDRAAIMVLVEEPTDMDKTSTFWIDNLQFDGTPDEIPNFNFEQWEEISFDEPRDWTTINRFSAYEGVISVEETADAFEGSRAMKITSYTQNIAPDIPPVLGLATTADLQDALLGFPANGQGIVIDEYPDKLTGHYKYGPDNNDTALVVVEFYYQGQEIYDTTIALTTQSEYTAFEMDFNLPSGFQADIAQIIFSSTHIESHSQVPGNELLIDNLEWHTTDEPVNALIPDTSGDHSYKIYPNPADNQVTIQGPLNVQADIRIFDNKGRKLLESKADFENGAHTVNISQLPEGVYFLSIETEDGIDSMKLQLREK